MVKNLRRVIAAELALHKHNKVNRQGVVSADAQTYHIIENVLPAEVYQGLLAAVDELHSTAVRENSHWRKGQALGGHELKQSAAASWLDYFSSQPFIEKLRSATGIKTLSLVPEVDTNRLSLLFYDEPPAADESGDGTDWHMDGSIYLGARWAGILTLIENTHDQTSKLELQQQLAPLQLFCVFLRDSRVESQSLDFTGESRRQMAMCSCCSCVCSSNHVWSSWSSFNILALAAESCWPFSRPSVFIVLQTFFANQ